jgi:hypothetical protein
MNNSKVLRIVVLVVLSLSLIVAIGACKKFGIPDYKITVVFETDGVKGTPAAGEYTYEDLKKVEYNYSAVDDEHSVEVYVNNEPWNSKGTITMYTDVAIRVKLFDVRGNWEVRFNDIKKVNIETFKMTVAGDDTVSGTFTDDRKKSGTWKKDTKYYIFTYSNWEGYELAGINQVSSSYTVMLAGAWKGKDKIGNWEAKRIE